MFILGLLGEDGVISIFAGLFSAWRIFVRLMSSSSFLEEPEWALIIEVGALLVCCKYLGKNISPGLSFDALLLPFSDSDSEQSL